MKRIEELCDAVNDLYARLAEIEQGKLDKGDFEHFLEVNELWSGK